MSFAYTDEILEPCPMCSGTMIRVLLNADDFSLGVECQHCDFSDESDFGYVLIENPILEPTC